MTGIIVVFSRIQNAKSIRNVLVRNGFSVTAACRGQGIGSRLLDMAEEYAAALGLGEIHLHVERDNHGARRLYRRRGFGVLAEQGARLLLGKKL